MAEILSRSLPLQQAGLGCMVHVSWVPWLSMCFLSCFCDRLLCVWVAVVLFLWCVWGFTEVLMPLKELIVSFRMVACVVLFISLFISL